ncbi:MAG: hypothetical protein WCJ30_24930 [Deltaproteobacteria bacterium]
MVAGLTFALLGSSCDTPQTFVLLENRYAPSPTGALVVYRAFWHAVSFGAPVLPGASSDPQPTVPASATTAYVLLAPGRDPSSTTSPGSFVVMQSRDGFGLHLNETLRIGVDDTTFVGNCAAGSPLTQEQADFITQRVFPGEFSTRRYDPAICLTTQVDPPPADAGGPG